MGKKTTQFLSLKWKILIILSLALIAINASFPLLSYNNLKREIQQEIGDKLIYTQREFHSALSQSSYLLQQIEQLIPALTLTTELLAENKIAELNQKLKHQGELLQLHLGIVHLSYFDINAQKISQWESSSQYEQALRQLVQAAISNETPQQVIYCQTKCTQYVISPLLHNGTQIGAITLGAPLVDIIFNYQHIENTDLGIVALAMEFSAPSDSQYIHGWNANIIGISNAQENTTLLQLLASKIPSINTAEGRHKITFKQQQYVADIHLQPELSAITPTYTVTFINTTDAESRLRAGATEGISAGIIGLIISESILLVLLWGPMARLSHVTNTLPLLAHSQYKKARLSLYRNGLTNRNDEIDLLEDATLDLSTQLEYLEDQVRKNTNELANKVEELSTERDFSKHILDTAQIVILTQSSNGKINTINEHGLQLLGYNKQEFQNLEFSQLLLNDDFQKNHLEAISKLCNNSKKSLHQELILVSKSGLRHSTTWIHTQLSQTQNICDNILSIGLDVTQRKTAESRLQWLSQHDPLTGLGNRRLLLENINTLIQKDDINTSFSLTLIDIDQFKYINDTASHRSGDFLLMTIANKLHELACKRDTIVRLGGDEFAILSPNTNQVGAQRLSDAIHLALSNLEFVAEERRHGITASIGVTLFPGDGKSANECLTNADLAMYQAKENGRGRTHFFTNDDQTRTRIIAEVDWKHRIEKALKEDRFVLVYQPILDLEKNITSHYEVLLRMRNDQNELLPPAEFIEVAERSGLIRAIDHYVVDRAVRELGRINQVGANISFSVNLSAHAFNDDEILNLISQALIRYRVTPETLVFEITETAALSDIISARKLMTSIKTLGCKFALDDFGVGFSSFRYIKELPFDYIKIDGSFIQNLSHNLEDQVLVKSLCDVAGSFGKTIVAEYVEDQETMDILRSFHVDLVQGYYIGTPIEVI